MSRRTVRSRRLLSSWPVAIWKRRLNSSSLASRSRACSSSSGSSRNSAGVVSALICSPPRSWHSSDLTNLALDETALEGKGVDRPAHRVPGHRLRHAGQLEHHPARLDVGDPPLRGALAGAHPGLGRLLGQRTVREDVDPHLATTADVPGHRDTRGLDLPVGHVVRLQRLDAVLAELDPGAALRRAGALRMVLLPVLDLARDHHGSALLLLGRLAGGAGVGAGLVAAGLHGGPAGLGAGPGGAGGAGASPATRTVPVPVPVPIPIPVTVATSRWPQLGIGGLAGDLGTERHV